MFAKYLNKQSRYISMWEFETLMRVKHFGRSDWKLNFRMFQHPHFSLIYFYICILWKAKRNHFFLSFSRTFSFRHSRSLLMSNRAFIFHIFVDVCFQSMSKMEVWVSATTQTTAFSTSKVYSVMYLSSFSFFHQQFFSPFVPFVSTVAFWAASQQCLFSSEQNIKDFANKKQSRL